MNLEDEKTEHFIKISKAIIESGVLAKMRPSVIKVYLDLCYHADYDRGTCFPNIKTICRETGVNKNAVCQATKELAAMNLIKKKRAPRAFKFKNVYSVIRNPEIRFDILPLKTEKRRPKSREKSGRWGVLPQKTESVILPLKTESVFLPQKTDTNDIERNLTRVSIATAPISISKEIIEEFRKLKGSEWIDNQLKSGKYVIEDEDSQKVKNDLP